MELNSLKETKDKIEELNREIEKKQRILEKLEEIKLREYNQKEKLKEELKSVSHLFDICNESNFSIYGVFNIKEIGDVLAKLTSKIIGIKYKFAITYKKDFTCINNHGINYDKEIATIIKKNEQDITPDWQFCFCVASNPTGEKEDCISYYCDGYGGYGTCPLRKLEKSKKLTEYNETTKTFDFKKIYGIETVDFISDFLVYVSNYRLENKLTEINKSDLEELLNTFLEKYETKYSRYKEEQKELEKSVKKRLEEIEVKNTLRFRPYYYSPKKIKRR